MKSIVSDVILACKTPIVFLVYAFACCLFAMIDLLPWPPSYCVVSIVPLVGSAIISTEKPLTQEASMKQYSAGS